MTQTATPQIAKCFYEDLFLVEPSLFSTHLLRNIKVHGDIKLKAFLFQFSFTKGVHENFSDNPRIELHR